MPQSRTVREDLARPVTVEGAGNPAGPPCGTGAPPLSPRPSSPPTTVLRQPDEVKGSPKGGGNPAAPSPPVVARASRPCPPSSYPAKDRLAHLRRTIFALCRERGIPDDLRHELQLSVTGQSSLSGCSAEQMLAIIARLSGQSVYSPQGMMFELAGRLDNGQVRLRAYCWKRYNREPKGLDARQTRSVIAFLRHAGKEQPLQPPTKEA